MDVKQYKITYVTFGPSIRSSRVWLRYVEWTVARKLDSVRNVMGGACSRIRSTTCILAQSVSKALGNDLPKINASDQYC